MALLCRALTLCLLCGVLLQAQAVPAPGEAIRAKVQSLALQSKISVVPNQGDEAFGRLVSDDANTFTYYDVDARTDRTLRYEDVREVKRGYAGYNSSTKRHTDRTRSRAVLFAMLGGLVVFVVVAGVVLHGS